MPARRQLAAIRCRSAPTVAAPQASFRQRYEQATPGPATPEFIRIAPRSATIRRFRARRGACNFPHSSETEGTSMVRRGIPPFVQVRRGIPPFVRETVERVIVGLWFTGVLLLLYLTLRSQLARGTEPEPDWDLVALCGGTVDVGAAGYGTDAANEPAAPARSGPAP
jgi:hypothetical protein